MSWFNNFNEWWCPVGLKTLHDTKFTKSVVKFPSQGYKITFLDLKVFNYIPYDDLNGNQRYTFVFVFVSQSALYFSIICFT